MAYKFGEEDTGEVTFVGEFGEKSGSGTAASELRIDGIDKVNAKGKRVNDNE